MFNRNYALEEVNSLKKAEKCNAKEEKDVFGPAQFIKNGNEDKICNRIFRKCGAIWNFSANSSVLVEVSILAYVKFGKAFLPKCGV